MIRLVFWDIIVIAKVKPFLIFQFPKQKFFYFETQSKQPISINNAFIKLFLPKQKQKYMNLMGKDETEIKMIGKLEIKFDELFYHFFQG